MSTTSKVSPETPVLLKVEGTWKGQTEQPLIVSLLSAYGYTFTHNDFSNIHEIKQLPLYLQSLIEHSLVKVLTRSGFAQQENNFCIILTEKELSVAIGDLEGPTRKYLVSEYVLHGTEKRVFYSLLKMAKKVANFAPKIITSPREFTPHSPSWRTQIQKRPFTAEELKKLNEERALCRRFTNQHEAVRDVDNVSSFSRLFAQSLEGPSSKSIPVAFWGNGIFSILRGILNPLYRVRNMQTHYFSLKEAQKYHDRGGQALAMINLFDQGESFLTNEVLMAWNICDIARKYCSNAAHVAKLTQAAKILGMLTNILWLIMSAVLIVSQSIKIRELKKFERDFQHLLQDPEDEACLAKTMQFLKSQLFITQAEKEEMFLKAQQKYRSLKEVLPQEYTKKVNKYYQKLCQQAAIKKKIKLERQLGSKAADKVLNHFTTEALDPKKLINAVQKGLRAQKFTAQVLLYLGIVMTALSIIGLFITTGPVGFAILVAWVVIIALFFWIDRGHLENISNKYHKKHKRFPKNSAIA
ncbi:MAG: SdpI family protein [Parachlamydiales bacterium]|nr:SdpI family protein [Parachlamydiales bacterium]